MVTFYYFAYFLKLGKDYFKILSMTDQSLKQWLIFSSFVFMLFYLVIFQLRTTLFDSVIYIDLFLGSDIKDLSHEKCHKE